MHRHLRHKLACKRHSAPSCCTAIQRTVALHLADVRPTTSAERRQRGAFPAKNQGYCVHRAKGLFF